MVMVGEETSISVTKRSLFMPVEEEYIYDFFKLIEYAYENITIRIDATDEGYSVVDLVSPMERITFEALEELLNSTTFIEMQKGVEINQYDLYLLEVAFENEADHLEYVMRELDILSYSQQTLLVLKSILRKINEILSEESIQEDIENFIQLSQGDKWELYWQVNTMKYNETKEFVFS